MEHVLQFFLLINGSITNWFDAFCWQFGTRLQTYYWATPFNIRTPSPSPPPPPPAVEVFISHPLRKVNFWVPKKRRSKCRHTPPSGFIKRLKVPTQLKVPSASEILVLQLWGGGGGGAVGGRGGRIKMEWYLWKGNSNQVTFLGSRIGFVWCIILLLFYFIILRKIFVKTPANLTRKWKDRLKLMNNS